MSYQVLLFEKNKIDISREDVTLTASQGQSYVEFVRNRNNTSGWATTGSVDSDLTNIIFDYSEYEAITDILLIKHNFKSYSIQYWNGIAYTDFSPAISVSGNTAETKRHSFTQVSTTKVKLIVNSTMFLNDDKFLRQFIVSKIFGQFNGWPTLHAPTLSKNRQIQTMLSGKQSVIENVGNYKVELKIQVTSDDDDLTLVESIYSQPEGLLLWPCGGSTSQFRTVREGLRLEDIYLVKPVNELVNEPYKGLYQAGMPIDLKFAEVID